MSECLRDIIAGRRVAFVWEVRAKGPNVRTEFEALARLGNNLNRTAEALNAGKESDAAMARAAEHTIGEFAAAARATREMAGRWTGDGGSQTPLEKEQLVPGGLRLPCSMRTMR